MTVRWPCDASLGRPAGRSPGGRPRTSLGGPVGRGHETIRQTLGEDTPLTLHSHVLGTDRLYPDLTSIERDAFMARIWGGLHVRDAMEDAYAIGHDVAGRALTRSR